MSLGPSMGRAFRAAGLAPVRGFLLLQKLPAPTNAVTAHFCRGRASPSRSEPARTELNTAYGPAAFVPCASGSRPPAGLVAYKYLLKVNGDAVYRGLTQIGEDQARS